MPRKSASALAVVSSVADYRPPPPESLTTEQAGEWVAVVGRMPSGWFTRETHELLASYCRHVTSARMLAKLIDAFRPEWLTDPDGVVRLDKLAKMRDREVRAMSSLATRMRITQQSRYRGETTATKVAKEPVTGRRPWEAHA
jgi:hypothetical protein